MSKPLVSVLIPCYNAERWIGETLDSVFAQTYPNIEVVVCDDGSTDRSAELVRKREGRVRLIRQENSGAAVARNAAFAASAGELLQFLDADDLLDPEKIATQVEALAARTNVVSAAEWGRFRQQRSETRFVPDPTWSDLDPVTWLVEAWSRGGGMMFPAMWLVPRAVAIHAGPWQPFLTLNDDGEYFTRVLLASERVIFARGARCHYRSGVVGSLSGAKSREAWESQFLATALCERNLRLREDSQRTRHACGALWRTMAHAAYPYAPQLAEHSLENARRLGAPECQPEGGPLFRILRTTLGWRIARRLQLLSGRS